MAVTLSPDRKTVEWFVSLNWIQMKDIMYGADRLTYAKWLQTLPRDLREHLYEGQQKRHMEWGPKRFRDPQAEEIDTGYEGF